MGRRAEKFTPAAVGGGDDPPLADSRASVSALYPLIQAPGSSLGLHIGTLFTGTGGRQDL